MRFGLNDLSDLPKVEDMADALGFEPPAGLAAAPGAQQPSLLDVTDEGGETIH